MASDIDICNMALSHIGEDALVVAISPPDGSVQAAHCARFWPIARSELLEVFDWAFAARREAALAAVASDSDAWEFCYTLPADCVKVRKVLAAGEVDEANGQPFVVMGTSLYTHEETPTLIYTALVTDPTAFTPTFVAAAGYLLAAYLCGPVLKKASAGQAYYDMAMKRAMGAAAVNANAAVSEQHDAPAGWMADR